MVWPILVTIIKVLLELKKISEYAKILSSGKPIEAFIRSFLGSIIIDSLESQGVPLKSLDLGKVAADWVKDKKGLFDFLDRFDPDDIGKSVVLKVNALFDGRYIHGSQSPSPNQIEGADPVNLMSGEFRESVDDMVLDGAGIKFSFTRTHRSQSRYIGPLGIGWDHSANLWLREEGPMVVARSTGELREVLHVLHPLNGQVGYSYFSAESGDDSVLVRDGNSFTLIKPQGERIRYEAEIRPGYHRAIEILDRYGNYIRFNYKEENLKHLEINNTQRFLSFEYDEADHLKGLTDHTGRRWQYYYDDQSLLVSIVTPSTPDQPEGAITSYEYSSQFAPERYPIIRVWDGEGRLRTENEYESSPSSPDFLRVTRQMERGGEHFFVYEDLPTKEDVSLNELRSLPKRLVHVYARNGHERKLWFNRYGQLLLEQDQLVDLGRLRYRNRLYRYNGDGHLVGSITPEGVITQHHYGRDEFYRDDTDPGSPVPLDDSLDLATRLGFGLELTRVTRAQLYWSAVSALSGENPFPDPLTAEKEDKVIKWTYDRDIQEETSRSDPESTLSPDLRHVESIPPGKPGHQPGNPQYIAHQKGLTRREYSLDPSHALLSISYPDVIYPSPVVGITGHTNLVESFIARDTNGRLLERQDQSGARWLFRYFDNTHGPSEGFLREEIKPHTDLLLDNSLPERADLRTTGIWTRDVSGWTSQAGSDASLTFEFEGGAVAWHVDTFDESVFGSHRNVHVELDGLSLPGWNQTSEPTRFHTDLNSGKHSIVFKTVNGEPFRIGRLRTYVVVSYERDELGRATVVRDERGFSTSREFESRDRVVRVTTPISTSTVDHYDAEGNIVQREKDRIDEQGVAEPGGPEVTCYEYDSCSNLVLHTVGADVEIRSNRHQYNIDSLELVRVLPRGNRVHFGYDEVGRRMWVALGACSNDISVSRRRYDLDDNEIASIDPLGRVTRKGRIKSGGGWSEGLDAMRHERLTFYPDGGLRHRDFDKRGNIIVDRHFEKLAEGNWALLGHSSFAYDPFDRQIIEVRARFQSPIEVVDPFSRPDEELQQKKLLGMVEELVTRYAYDRVGHRTHTITPDEGVTRQVFDSHGRIVLDEPPNGSLEVTYYDAVGNQIRIDQHICMLPIGGIGPVAKEVVSKFFEYDSLSRKVGEIDSMGNRWSWYYDSRNNVRKQVDPLGNVHLREIDIFGQLVAENMQTTDTGTGNGNPSQEITIRYIYDYNGNLIELHDPRGQVTLMSYDSMDRRISEKRGTGTLVQQTLLVYDPAGNVIRRTRPSGLVERLVYNPANRLIGIDIDTGGISSAIDVLGTGAATNEEFAYDSLGRRVKHENDHCSVDIQYDSIGNAFAETIILKGPHMPAVDPFRIERHLDYAGRILQINYPSGRRIRYQRKPGGALQIVDQLLRGSNYPGHSRTPDLVLLTKFEQGGGRIRSASLGNGWTWKLDVDASGKPIRHRARHDVSGAYFKVVYLHDGAGNVREQLEEFVNSGIAGGDYRINRRMSYDSLYRLTHFQDDAPIAAFNPAILAPPSSPPTITDLTGQAILNDALGPLNMGHAPHIYEYDDNGNRCVARESNSPVLLYHPDALDRYHDINDTILSHRSSGSLQSDGRHSFSYDHAERLIEIFDEMTGDCIHSRLLDALGRPVLEHRPSGDTVLVWDDTRLIEEYQGSRPAAQHVYVNDRGAPLHSAVSSNDLWFIEDLRGSVRLILDHNGLPISGLLYSPFGKATSHFGTLRDGSFGFSGHRHEVAAGLIWLPHRVYDPINGRFLQVDPAGRLDGLNPYTYTHNNPGTLIDPTGLMALAAIPILIASVGYLVGLTSYLFNAAVSEKSVNFGEMFLAGLAGAATGLIVYNTFGLKASITVGAARLIAPMMTGGLDKASMDKSFGNRLLGFLSFSTKFASSPITSSIGLLIGGFGTGFGLWGDVEWFKGGVIAFEYNKSGFSAVTLGATINIWQGSTNHPLFKHELYHSRQYTYFGDMFVPAWVLGGVYGLISSAIADKYQKSCFYSTKPNKLYGNPTEDSAHEIARGGGCT